MHINTDRLAQFVRQAGTVTALTGAGVSSASGIPGYRDRDGNWKHTKPVQFNDFRNSATVRRHYWARSYAGWQRMSSARPNSAHFALAALQQRGICKRLITQNVDGLHDRAGHRRAIELHGCLDTVRCLNCDKRTPRSAWQSGLVTVNPDWQSRVTAIKPDGDVQLQAGDASSFVVPDCEHCGGIVKPDVVFFGEAVPRERVDAAVEAINESGALLIVGSSLMVFSGYRYARLALEIGKPVAIVNQGRTRADEIASLKIDGDCGDVLPDMLRHIETSSVVAGLYRE